MRIPAATVAAQPSLVTAGKLRLGYNVDFLFRLTITGDDYDGRLGRADS